MVVGWYHSHPGFGCWLSGVDINTQQVCCRALLWSGADLNYVPDPTCASPGEHRAGISDGAAQPPAHTLLHALRRAWAPVSLRLLRKLGLLQQSRASSVCGTPQPSVLAISPRHAGSHISVC